MRLHPHKMECRSSNSHGYKPQRGDISQPRVVTQSAPRTFASRSASRVEAAGERFLLAVSPEPWVTSPRKGRALKGRPIVTAQHTAPNMERQHFHLLCYLVPPQNRHPERSVSHLCETRSRRTPQDFISPMLSGSSPARKSGYNCSRQITPFWK